MRFGWGGGDGKRRGGSSGSNASGHVRAWELGALKLLGFDSEGRGFGKREQRTAVHLEGEGHPPAA